MRLRPPVAAICLVLTASAALSCAQQGQQAADGAAVDTAAVEASLDSVRSAFEAATEAGDYDAQAAAFAEDAIYSPPMSPPVRGRDSIRAHLERSTPSGATLRLRPVDTRILGPDRAYEYGTATTTFTPEGADEPRSASSTYAVFLERTAAGWKIVQEVVSSHQPPPGGGQ